MKCKVTEESVMGTLKGRNHQAMKDHLQKMEAHGESSTVQFSQKLENQDG
jgi:hypothetical protein